MIFQLVKKIINSIFSSAYLFLAGGILLINTCAFGQTVTIDLASSTNVDFTFNTINKLTNGIVIPNAITFNVASTAGQWDLYVGSVTTIAGTWDNARYYTSTGNGAPPVSLLEMRVHNLSNTQQISGYVPMQDVSTTTLDIIGNHLSAPDPTVNCSDIVHVGTNTIGSYIMDPQCFQFRVDLKIVPGFNYRPGLYTMQIEYIIAEDL